MAAGNNRAALIQIRNEMPQYAQYTMTTLKMILMCALVTWEVAGQWGLFWVWISMWLVERIQLPYSTLLRPNLYLCTFQEQKWCLRGSRRRESVPTSSPTWRSPRNNTQTCSDDDDDVKLGKCIVLSSRIFVLFSYLAWMCPLIHFSELILCLHVKICMWLKPDIGFI